MLIENILLVILWSLGLESTPYGWSLSNILIGVFAAFFIGLLFMVLYYRQGSTVYSYIRLKTLTLPPPPNDNFFPARVCE
jgi:hypothetical protein